MDQDKIYSSLQQFVKRVVPKNISRPEHKFFLETLSGVVCGASMVITEICRTLSNTVNFKTTYKRIERNLNEYSLLNMQEKAGLNNIKNLGKDDIIAVDMGDIVKPLAKKMEYLAHVADGSDDHKIKNGYWLLGAAAINMQSDEKTPLPIHLEIFSTEEPSHISENTKMIALFEKIAFFHCGKDFADRPAVVLDRGGDRGVLLNKLVSLNLPFVVRMDKRYLRGYENNETIKIGQRPLERKNLPYSVMIQRVETTNKTARFQCKFDYQKVRIESIPSIYPLYLITAWKEGCRKPIELVTNKLIQNENDAIKIILSYFSRWSVEETYRFLKGRGLESIRAINFIVIKNLVALAFLASVFIASLVRYKSDFKLIINKHIKRLKKAPAKLFNWLNRAADVVAILFQKFLYKINRKKRQFNIFPYVKTRILI